MAWRQKHQIHIRKVLSLTHSRPISSVPAEHQYTEGNLSFSHLKGADRAMVRALETCPGLDAHLVLVTRRVEGGTDSPCCYYKRRRCGGWYCDYDDSCDDEDDDEGGHTMGEVSPWEGRCGSCVGGGRVAMEVGE
jgi:hypothetical protein